jgi:hypothetical protein
MKCVDLQLQNENNIPHETTFQAKTVLDQSMM